MLYVTLSCAYVLSSLDAFRADASMRPAQLLRDDAFAFRGMPRFHFLSEFSPSMFSLSSAIRHLLSKDYIFPSCLFSEAFSAM